MLITLITI